MIPAPLFGASLRDRGYRVAAGVPCSYFGGAYNWFLDEPGMTYVGTANEGSALAVAAGAALAGRKAVIMIQNSGLGNLINPLTSLILPCEVPVLMFISGRGFPDPSADEPQHRIMGITMQTLLADLGVRHRLMPDDAAAFASALAEYDDWTQSARRPAAFIVGKGTIGQYPRRGQHVRPCPSLSRQDAVRLVTAWQRPDDIVVAATGYIARELFRAGDRPGNFYMQGSMGHAGAIGLGLALGGTQRRVIVLDGDGAVLMHMGTLSTIGFYAPANLVHIVLDNEAYESTGGQPATSSTTDLADVARACGYRWAVRCKDVDGLAQALGHSDRPGPGLIHAKIAHAEDPAPPRVTERHSPAENADAVASFVGSR